MFVKPAPWPVDPTVQMKVRDPHTNVPVPAEGRHVPAETDTAWHRLLLQGDIVQADPPADHAAEPAAAQE